MIDTWFWGFAVALFGLVAGSFAGAQVWRLRLSHVLSDRADRLPYDSTELKRLNVLSVKKGEHDRSRCLECGHRLAWYDLLPLLSWVSTAGKCRYCRSKIGWFEPVIELVVMVIFITSYLFWPYEYNSYSGGVLLAIWLLSIIPLAIGFVYDLRWSYLPDITTYSYIILASIYVLIAVVFDAIRPIDAVYSLGLFAGVYALLYYFSRWRYGTNSTWVGFGDVKLSIGLGIFLASWQLSFLAIFLANFIGTLIVLPGLLSGKLSRKARIPFGPLLMVGTFVALLFGGPILSWYLALFSL